VKRFGRARSKRAYQTGLAALFFKLRPLKNKYTEPEEALKKYAFFKILQSLGFWILLTWAGAIFFFATHKDWLNSQPSLRPYFMPLVGLFLKLNGMAFLVGTLAFLPALSIILSISYNEPFWKQKKETLDLAISKRKHFISFVFVLSHLVILTLNLSAVPQFSRRILGKANVLTDTSLLLFDLFFAEIPKENKELWENAFSKNEKQIVVFMLPADVLDNPHWLSKTKKKFDTKVSYIFPTKNQQPLETLTFWDDLQRRVAISMPHFMAFYRLSVPFLSPWTLGFEKTVEEDSYQLKAFAKSLGDKHESQVAVKTLRELQFDDDPGNPWGTTLHWPLDLTEKERSVIEARLDFTLSRLMSILETNDQLSFVLLPYQNRGKPLSFAYLKNFFQENRYDVSQSLMTVEDFFQLMQSRLKGSNMAGVFHKESKVCENYSLDIGFLKNSDLRNKIDLNDDLTILCKNTQNQSFLFVAFPPSQQENLIFKKPLKNLRSQFLQNVVAPVRSIKLENALKVDDAFYEQWDVYQIDPNQNFIPMANTLDIIREFKDHLKESVQKFSLSAIPNRTK